jgi:hypothetical protein
MESTNKKTTRDYKEMLLLKGIGSELEKMAYPKVSNLKSMLETFGYTIEPLQHKYPKSSLDEASEDTKLSY